MNWQFVLTTSWLVLLSVAVSFSVIIALASKGLLQSLIPKINCGFEQPNDYERWLKHAIRLFPDGGIALVNNEGVIAECSVGFSTLVNAATTSECIGRNIDSFHEDPEVAKQLRTSMRRDIIRRPVSFVCIGGTCKMVLLSVFDLRGMWLVRLVENV